VHKCWNVLLGDEVQFNDVLLYIFVILFVVETRRQRCKQPPCDIQASAHEDTS